MNNKENEKLSKYISIDEVQKIVKKLKNSKSRGVDGVVNELIKYSPILLIIKLIKLYNLCLIKEKIPEIWKLSLIRMLLKDKSNVNFASNYRGIALLLITYKIYSTIITKRLYKYVESNNLIGELQLGFIKYKSTKQAIRILINTYENTLINNKELWAVFYDIYKAYDTMEF